MPKLYPEDQEKVDAFLRSNVNDIEREPFRPLRLLFVIILLLTMMSVGAYFVALNHGVV